MHALFYIIIEQQTKIKTNYKTKKKKERRKNEQEQHRDDLNKKKKRKKTADINMTMYKQGKNI